MQTNPTMIHYLQLLVATVKDSKCGECLEMEISAHCWWKYKLLKIGWADFFIKKLNCHMICPSYVCMYSYIYSILYVHTYIYVSVYKYHMCVHVKQRN